MARHRVELFWVPRRVPHSTVVNRQFHQQSRQIWLATIHIEAIVSYNIHGPLRFAESHSTAQGVASMMVAGKDLDNERQR